MEWLVLALLALATAAFVAPPLRGRDGPGAEGPGPGETERRAREERRRLLERLRSIDADCEAGRISREERLRRRRALAAPLLAASARPGAPAPPPEGER